MTTRSATPHPDCKTLAAVIARSSILLARAITATRRRRLPAGFDDTDIAVLEWIAAEGRRATRTLALI